MGLTNEMDRNYSIRTLFGKRDEEILEIYARQIIQAQTSLKPLLLSIALKDYSGKTMRDILSIIQNHG